MVAIFAKSQAMIGDSAAMAVDALAYGFNLLAEREKTPAIEGETITAPLEAESAKADRRMRHKRRQLHLELVPPLISVFVLLIVVGYVLNNAIRTLILDVSRSETKQSRPNIMLMMTFSSLNLLVDILNVMCFARANHLTGYNTVLKQPTGGRNNETDDNERLIGQFATHFEIHDAIVGGRINEQRAVSSHINYSSEEVISEEENEDDSVNLNMCSAYTVSLRLCLELHLLNSMLLFHRKHRPCLMFPYVEKKHIFADTLRSLSVIIAAIIAFSVDSVSPEVADSTAALIVSIIIFMSLLPLFRGIMQTWGELQSISREVPKS